MKTTHIEINANQTLVGIDELRGKGQSYFPFQFTKGAVYQFPEETKCVEEKFRKRQDFVIVKILSFRNPDTGNQPTWIPLGAFSQAPDSSMEDRMKFLEDNPTNQEFIELPDFEQRVLKIEEYAKSGKKLHIKDVVTLKRRRWHNRELVVDENGKVVLDDHTYPIFEWIQ